MEPMPTAPTEPLQMHAAGGRPKADAAHTDGRERAQVSVEVTPRTAGGAPQPGHAPLAHAPWDGARQMQARGLWGQLPVAGERHAGLGAGDPVRLDAQRAQPVAKLFLALLLPAAAAARCHRRRVRQSLQGLAEQAAELARPKPGRLQPEPDRRKAERRRGGGEVLRRRDRVGGRPAAAAAAINEAATIEAAVGPIR